MRAHTGYILPPASLCSSYWRENIYVGVDTDERISARTASLASVQCAISFRTSARLDIFSRIQNVCSARPGSIRSLTSIHYVWRCVYEQTQRKRFQCAHALSLMFVGCLNCSRSPFLSERKMLMRGRCLISMFSWEFVNVRKRDASPFSHEFMFSYELMREYSSENTNS